MFAAPPRLFRPPDSRWRRYAIAAALVGGAALVRVAIDPLTGPVAPFGLFVPAVVLATWLGGSDGGLLATILAALAGKFLFIEPRYRLTFTSRDVAVMLMALVVGYGLVRLVSSWGRTQFRLQDLRDEMAGILRQVPTGIVVADLAGQVVFANEEIERLLGQPVEPGRPLDFGPRHPPPGDASPSARVGPPLLRAASGEDVPEQEAEIVRRDGTTRVVRICGTPVRRHDGTVVGGAVAVVDVTDRMQLEVKLREQARELERANRVKDEFLATLSHELRTPLTAIVGWAAMLLKGGLSPDLARRAHEAIARNAEAQRALIEDVLDVSRIVSGRLRLELGQADVAGPVRAAVEAVRPQADEKGITITVAFSDEGTSVWGDSARLQQVFVNLLSNAVKFSDRGSRVWVSVRRTDERVQVEVRDHGAGIPPAQLPHIFERFRQADNSTTRRHTGLGLGLSIVKHLVHLHGGTVEAASAGEGRGATFTVCLPHHLLRERRVGADEPHRDGPAIRPVSMPAPSLCGRRVLVVDDEADTRELVTTILSASGAEVTTAASGREALEHLRGGVPDALLVDISMPEMDGYALIQAVRASGEEAERVPAIAFTAYARDEDRQRTLLRGFRLHVTKPVDPSTLIRAVASVLDG